MRKLTFPKVARFWHRQFFIFTFLPLVMTKSTVFKQWSKILKLAPWKNSVGSVLFSVVLKGWLTWGSAAHLCLILSPWEKNSGSHLLNFPSKLYWNDKHLWKALSCLENEYLWYDPLLTTFKPDFKQVMLNFFKTVSCDDNESSWHPWEEVINYI